MTALYDELLAERFARIEVDIAAGQSGCEPVDFGAFHETMSGYESGPEATVIARGRRSPNLESEVTA